MTWRIICAECGLPLVSFGGEERDPETAKGEVMRAMVRQIMRDPMQWHATERRRKGAPRG